MLKREELMNEAKKARENSYSPYSHFAVGAALECKDGTVFYGANIENPAYGLCMCAERNAIFNAYNHGYRKDDFVALALIAESSQMVTPCGSCRQVIAELFPSEAPIYMGTMKGLRQDTTIKELLPYAFNDGNL